LAIVALAWEAFARSGIYKPVLVPSLEQISRVFWQMTQSGALQHDIAYTCVRLFAGFLIGASFGGVLGLLMARSAPAERFFLPLVSVLNPIPSLALIPLFVLWFGLGETAVVVLVAFASSIPVIINVWSGVKAVNEIWIRAAESMNCRGLKLFYLVVLPAAIPQTISGLRGGLGRGFRAVVAGEMIAATQWGLGWVIFNSIAFLNTAAMLTAIAFIGVIGLLVENFIFSAIERATVVRWGLLRETSN
jgi:NitT/TauT family transport system permease protein